MAPELHMPRAAAIALGLLSVVAIAVVDAVTDVQLSVGQYYTLPVLVLAWQAGLVWGLAGTVISGALLFAVGLVFGHAYQEVGYFIFDRASTVFALALIAWLGSGLRRAHDEALRLSRRDPLTGLPNRTEFLERVRYELRRHRRTGQPLSAVFIDCDHFKAVNDEYGHAAGDELLRAVALVMVRGLRETDTAARLGGDEFVMLLPETGSEETSAVVSALRARLDAAMRGESWPVSFSIGVATFDSMPRNEAEILAAADRAMYAVKHSGRNAIGFAVCGRGSVEVPGPREPAERARAA